jgi:hypothetical protein
MVGISSDTARSGVQHEQPLPGKKPMSVTIPSILYIMVLPFLCILLYLKIGSAVSTFGCQLENVDKMVVQDASELVNADGKDMHILCDGSSEDYDFLWNELRTPCLKQGYSQGNQDCQLDKIFEHIGTTNKYFVEYGFNTKKQCSGSGPNTCKLWKVHGWSGLLLDGDNENPEINLHAHYLYGTNAADVLNMYNVPEELDFLSGDMDSHDYFVMDNILTKYRPRVVTTEYNVNWPENMTLSQIDPKLAAKPSPNSIDSFVFAGCIWGASASALRFLMEGYGYALVGVSPDLDLIWGRKDLFSCYDIPSFESYVHLMRLNTLMHAMQLDLSFLDKLVDTVVWEKTKDIDQARHSARLILEKNMALDRVLPCLSKVKKTIEAEAEK